MEYDGQYFDMRRPRPPATSLYIDRGQTNAAVRRVIVDGLGIHERMPPGLIRHGGIGLRYPYLLVLFHTPSQMMLQDGQATPAGGKIVLWGWNSTHCYGNPRSDWDHSWLRLTGLWAGKAFRRCGLAENVPLPCRSPDAVAQRMEGLYSELARSHEQDTPMVEALLDVLWAELVRSCGHNAAGPADPAGMDDRIVAARQTIEGGFTGPFDLDELAAVACLSPAHFCHLFSRQVGVSPGEYVIRLRMYRARQLLSDPSLSVSRVANLVGYDDPYYFSRLFRKRHGRCPSEFRRGGIRPE